MCEKYNIPTAKFGIFKNNNDAQKFLGNCKYPIVVKADGLAAGKGVYICNNKNGSFSAIKEIFEGKFGDADSVLIEEFLKGEEMSFFIISDGKIIKYLVLLKITKEFLRVTKEKIQVEWEHILHLDLKVRN